MKMIAVVSPEEIHDCAVKHGWWDKSREVPELLCLIHSEVSEALEAYRIHDKENLAEELADTVIRIFDMCARFNIDIADEVRKKYLKNLDRPYRHGGKEC